MSHRNITTAAWVLAAVWFGVLYWLSSGPLESMPGGKFPNIDKVYHAGYYFLGGIVFTLALASTFTLSHRAIVVLVILVITGVGLFDEWHQSFSPGRSGGDSGDLAADIIGGALAVLILIFFNHGRLIRSTQRNAAS
jgi:VanZ family protein